MDVCILTEGMEEPDQLERQKAHGCRMAQGWLFGKALPSENCHPAALAMPAIDPTQFKPVPNHAVRKRIHAAPLAESCVVALAQPLPHC